MKIVPLCCAVVAPSGMSRRNRTVLAAAEQQRFPVAAGCDQNFCTTRIPLAYHASLLTGLNRLKFGHSQLPEQKSQFISLFFVALRLGRTESVASVVVDA
jgi:hypothetical protein